MLDFVTKFFDLLGWFFILVPLSINFVVLPILAKYGNKSAGGYNPPPPSFFENILLSIMSFVIYGVPFMLIGVALLLLY